MQSVQSQKMYQGLSSAEAQARLKQYGPNSLPEKAPKTIWHRLLSQFQSPLIYILLFALMVDLVIWVIEGAHGWPAELFAIALILLFNAALGVYQESKAESAIEKLKELAAALVWVVRDKKLIRLPNTDLVRGDVVRVEAGDRIPADGTFIEAHGIMADESALTGESVPIDKDVGGEAFRGTLLVRGKGYLEISRTGADSAMGRLAVMLEEIEAEKTPLERRLIVFGNQIARVIFLLAVIITIGGLFIEGFSRIGHVLLFAVALAVAAVPEGLPAALTFTLALGVERMAKRKAVVRRLSAVESLGSVTVIATDKTGTLTENRMYVKDVDTPDEARSLRAMLFANDAEMDTGAGDPLEIALLDYANAKGVVAARLNVSHPRQSVLPFDSSYKFMRVTVIENDRPVSYLKGAPEVLLERSALTGIERQNWEEKAEAYAREGYKVLGLAWGEGERDKEISFLGLVLLWDPPRAEAPEAIRRAQEAGIRVVMITGDHPATAVAVAREVGLPPSRVLTGLDLETLRIEALCEAVKETNIFARVTPEHKLRLVETLKKNGEIVAVTGDGVNDAPALKRSDVGVAMGQRGSDVSREVSDLILLDDNFSTIVAAIEEGRSIYENIQKFIRLLFSTNFALVLLVTLGAIGSYLLGLQDEGGGLLLPLTAIQLLWINIIGNGPPSLVLGLDRNPFVMQQGPRDPRTALLDRASMIFILTNGTVKALVGGILLVSMPLYGFTLATTRSVVFLYESIAQLIMAYPSRRISLSPQVNLTLHFTVMLGIGLQLLTVTLPDLRQLLGLESLGFQALAWVLCSVSLTWATAQISSRIKWPRNKGKRDVFLCAD
jgi:Ca2+-transporting ATPase